MEAPRIRNRKWPNSGFVANFDRFSGEARSIHVPAKLVVRPERGTYESASRELDCFAFEKRYAEFPGAFPRGGKVLIYLTAPVLMVAEHGDNLLTAGELSQKLEAAFDVALPNIARGHQDVEVGPGGIKCRGKWDRLKVEIR
jgi:hypothetical protein